MHVPIAASFECFFEFLGCSWVTYRHASRNTNVDAEQHIVAVMYDARFYTVSCAATMKPALSLKPAHAKSKSTTSQSGVRCHRRNAALTPAQHLAHGKQAMAPLAPLLGGSIQHAISLLFGRDSRHHDPFPVLKGYTAVLSACKSSRNACLALRLLLENGPEQRSSRFPRALCA